MKTLNLSFAILAVCVVAASAFADDAKQDRRADFRKQLVERFDKDGDGKLNEQELAAARKEFEKRRAQNGGGQRLNREEFLKKFDKNENGKIDPDERAAVAEFRKKQGPGQDRPRPGQGGGRLKEAIKRFDADGDGKLSEEERKKARAFFQKQGAGRFRELVKKFDKDGDGKLNEEERAAMRKFLEENGGKSGDRARPRPDGADRRPRPEGAKGRLNKEEILKRFDKNGDGKIDAEERKAALEARKAKKDTE